MAKLIKEIKGLSGKDANKFAEKILIEKEKSKFNLSDKINVDCEFNPKQWIEVYYVKEFIKQIEKELKLKAIVMGLEEGDFFSKVKCKSDVMNIIKELAGDKLI